jgi:signal transduction histidine kinase
MLRALSLLPGRSLRGRLILAFAGIIALTLLLVAIGFIFILRQHQEQRELIRLGALAGPVSFQVRALEQQGASVEEIAGSLVQQADDLDVRMVLIDRQGLISHDTEAGSDRLVGQRIDFAGGQRLGPLRRSRLLRVAEHRDRPLHFVAAAPGPPGAAGERFPGRPGGHFVALVSEPPTFWLVVREMAPRLVIPALVSLLASIGVAWLLAASIARPLARMTQAAEQIARGNYDQAISEGGADEIGRLGIAFNTMAREVARSQRALRDFVANVSHDLRTPLTSIQGFSQAMVEGALPRGGYVEAGRIINKEAARMRRLVEDLLELSKIESGEAMLTLEPVELVPLARRAGERAAAEAAERGVELAYRFEARQSVEADLRYIERVLDNLILNAVKHTPRGGKVTLTVTGDKMPPGETKPHASITVHNTGSVIPEQDLPRIFERFYRVDKSRAGSAEGSGLGLAIAREIVQSHGGQISATSSTSAGTEFVVRLPALAGTPVVGLRSGADIQAETAGASPAASLTKPVG